MIISIKTDAAFSAPTKHLNVISKTLNVWSWPNADMR